MYAGDDGLLLSLLTKGSAGSITAASNVNCALGAEVYANWDNAKGAAAQEILSATRKAVISVPLFVDPGTRIRVDTRSGEYVARA